MPGIKVNNPDGAFYFFPDVSSYFGKQYKGQVIHNATDLSMFLLNEGHVAIVTGAAFGDEKCLRISYATSNEKLVEAMKRMKETLVKLN